MERDKTVTGSIPGVTESKTPQVVITQEDVLVYSTTLQHFKDEPKDRFLKKLKLLEKLKALAT
jgi:hypothetical protein